MAVTDNGPAKRSNGRGFIDCEHPVGGTAGIRLIDQSIGDPRFAVTM